jgi:hypothetical protein
LKPFSKLITNTFSLNVSPTPHTLILTYFPIDETFEVEHQNERRLKNLKMESIENEIWELEAKNQLKRKEIQEKYGYKEPKDVGE